MKARIIFLFFAFFSFGTISHGADCTTLLGLSFSGSNLISTGSDGQIFFNNKIQKNCLEITYNNSESLLIHNNQYSSFGVGFTSSNSTGATWKSISHFGQAIYHYNDQSYGGQYAGMLYYPNNNVFGSYGNCSVGQTCMFCHDVNNNVTSIYKNNSLITTATTPFTGLEYFGFNLGPNGSIKINFGEKEPFENSLPNGYNKFSDICSSTPPPPTVYTLSDGQTCRTYPYATGYGYYDDWGTQLALTVSTGSTVYNPDSFWTTFTNSSKQYTTYDVAIYYGTGSRKDWIGFSDTRRINFQGDFTDPYAGGHTEVQDGEILIFSMSGGTYRDIDGIELIGATQQDDNTISQGYVEFLDSGENIIRSEYLYSSGTSLVARLPSSYFGHGKKIRIKNFYNLEFSRIEILKITTTENKASCEGENAKCVWRYNENTLHCVNEGFWNNASIRNDADINLSDGCQIVSNTCKMIQGYMSGIVFLGSEGIKASIIQGGGGKYTIDGSGNIILVSTGSSIYGVSGSSAKIECNTEGLSWFEVPFKYLDCEWEKITNTAENTVNAPTRISNDTIGTIMNKTGSGNGLSSIIGVGQTGSTISALQWIQDKKFSDTGRGWTSLLMNVVYIGMVMIFLSFIIGILSNKNSSGKQQ